LNGKIYFHPAAEDELVAAQDWFQARSIRAAERFMQEIEATLDRIRRSSAQFPRFTAGTRRAILHRFPYALIFSEGAEGIQIYAVAHAKRRPGYWRTRINRP